MEKMYYEFRKTRREMKKALREFEGLENKEEELIHLGWVEALDYVMKHIEKDKK